MPKVLIHVQHLLGVGHQRRTAAIARALRANNIDVCYVSGGLPMTDLNIADSEFVQLAPARARDVSYRELVDEFGGVVDEHWRQRRRDHLLDILQRYRPDVLLIETYPFGRKLLEFELQPLLIASKVLDPKPLVVCSIRDILEPKRKAKRNQQIVEAIHQWFDLVLVHGDSHLIPLAASFASTAAIAEKVMYSGYVVDVDATSKSERSDDEILVSAGGGVGGEQLLRTSIAAARSSRGRPWQWRCLAGPNLTSSITDGDIKSAWNNLIVEPNRSDFHQLLANCAVSVSQAGYNTALEAFVLRTPSVFVPFAEGHETEQTRRANVIAKFGLATVVPADHLSDELLMEAIEQRMQAKSVESVSIKTNGAEQSAKIIVEQLDLLRT